MKPTIFMLGIVALCCTIGVVTFLLFANRRANETAVPPVENQLSTKCSDELFIKTNKVVISVPNDDECYIGKQKVEKADIPAKLRPLLSNVDFCYRVVFIKAASEVKLETLVQIERQARDAQVNRVEFVLDKKKRGGNQ